MTTRTDPRRRTAAQPDEPSARAAFTLIELLIVVSIISVLIALLLPAIQSARENARRTQCCKNLMQIGIALANYASSHRVYPPGVVNDRGPISNLPQGYHFGWAAQILPFLDQPAAFNQFNFHESVYNAANATARGRRFQIYACPSDPLNGNTSYAACHHDVEAPIDADNHGAFYLNSRTSRADLSDGPAYTLFVGETRMPLGPGWAVGTWSTLRNAGAPINADDPYHRLFDRGSSTGGLDLAAIEARFEEAGVPITLVGGFLSHHPGGANFLMGDGSVRFLKERIEQRVYRSLAHRSDGGLISADEF